MKKALLLLPLALLLVVPACKKKTHKKPIIKTHKTGLGKHKVDYKKTFSVKKVKAKKPKAKIQGLVTSPVPSQTDGGAG